jgi:DNA-directed RNA polymerase specialized sigma24 family protein
MGRPGSPETVQRLVEEHYAALYRYAYRLSGSSVEAEDLTQEAFCKAQASLAQLRDPARAKAYLRSRLLPPGEPVASFGPQPGRANDGL